MSEALLTERLDGFRLLFEEKFPSYLPPTGDLQDTVVRAMHYACAAGGKRIRPVLTLEFCRVCGGDPAQAMPFAAAVEMIHSYSLVHDDLPCMDNSPLRRGRPSTHAAFGEAMGLLAGDALLNMAFETMLDPRFRGDVPAERAANAAYALGRGAGIFGMVGGQVIDLESEGKPIGLSVLERLQEGKTAALLIAACEMGCLIGGGSAEQLAAARVYGECVGRCFQMVDDLLDVTSTAEELGKPVGSDAENGKVTYVSLLGQDEVRRQAAELTDRAVAAAAVFGEKGEDLQKLAKALLTRRK